MISRSQRIFPCGTTRILIINRVDGAIIGTAIIVSVNERRKYSAVRTESTKAHIG
jgi:hypothetical protein